MEYHEFVKKTEHWIRSNCVEDAEFDVQTDQPGEFLETAEELAAGALKDCCELSRAALQVKEEFAGLDACPVEFDLELVGEGCLSSLAFYLEVLYVTYLDAGWGTVARTMRNAMRKAGMLKKSMKRADEYASMLDAEGQELFGRLRQLRAGIARELGLPPYVIFSNETLYEMCTAQPKDMEELLQIHGVGARNSALFGEQFLQALGG